jgi:predicted enzyme involved in methoxymalonyl-ACP biosynthesis
MSCRVLKRGMEHFVLNTLVNFGVENKFTTLKGEYIPTAKNEMVANHYQNLGFEKTGEHWKLDLNNYTQKKTYISKK